MTFVNMSVDVEKVKYSIGSLLLVINFLPCITTKSDIDLKLFQSNDDRDNNCILLVSSFAAFVVIGVPNALINLYDIIQQRYCIAFHCVYSSYNFYIILALYCSTFCMIGDILRRMLRSTTLT